MAGGCGLSRKTNRRTGTAFLYFWRYEGGEKHEQYLGRADDREAKMKGLRLMLSFYRRQDEALHRIIGEIVEKLTVGGGVTPPSPPPGASDRHRPDYLPETED